jgi:membrane-bound inhibitor of C-type lysozyme
MNTVLTPDARRFFAAARSTLKSLAGGHQPVAAKLLAGLILTCLVSIGSASSASAASASYHCSDGTSVRAVFRGLGSTGSVQLTFAGQGRPTTIPQAPSADGGRYTGGDTEFWIKGTTARLTRQGTTTPCRTASQ